MTRHAVHHREPKQVEACTPNRTMCRMHSWSLFLCSAGFQPAVSPTSSQQAARHHAWRCGLEIRDTAQRGEAATEVTQNCILPYRRVALCGASSGNNAWPNTIRRYSRLKICATENRRSRRRFLEIRIDWKSALRASATESVYDIWVSPVSLIHLPHPP